MAELAIEFQEESTAAPLWAEELAEQAESLMFCDRWTDFADAGNGWRVRARIEGDSWPRIEDYDGFSEVVMSDGRTNEFGHQNRPAKCDGSAVKIHQAGWHEIDVWLIPAEGSLDYPEEWAAHVKRMKAFYRNEWSFVWIEVEVRGPECSKCHKPYGERASCGGIESDAGKYFAVMIAELAAEAGLAN